MGHLRQLRFKPLGHKRDGAADSENEEDQEHMVEKEEEEGEGQREANLLVQYEQAVALQGTGQLQAARDIYKSLLRSSAITVTPCSSRQIPKAQRRLTFYDNFWYERKGLMAWSEEEEAEERAVL